MVYGVNASVTLLVGGLQNTAITSANIDAAIVMADVYVDKINSSAPAATKTQASNEIAANIILYAQANSELRGLKNVGQTNGTEGIAGDSNTIKFVTDEIESFLLKSTSSTRIGGRFVSDESTSYS